jgi:hypothetical protein
MGDGGPVDFRKKSSYREREQQNEEYRRFVDEMKLVKMEARGTRKRKKKVIGNGND